MHPKSLITIAATAALIGVPAPALAARPADPGPPAHAGHPAGQAKGNDHGAGATAPGAGQDEYTDPLGPPKPKPGPTAPAAAKAKAYGRYCAKMSRKHVAGQKGTPFSQCVTAMARIAHGTAKSPTRACKALSHKHVAGTRGTPFSRCVVGAAKLKAQLAAS